MELGNHAEFLGVMSRTEMLSMFFVHDGGDTSKWRIKGHAEGKFWEWVASWACMLRRPSDLGYDDNGFILPELNVTETILASEGPADGYLFPSPAETLQERRGARRASLAGRVEAAAKAYQKLTLIAPNMTMNSPTKPLVPGKPLLAMANSMKKAANTGIVLTTPP